MDKGKCIFILVVQAHARHRSHADMYEGRHAHIGPLIKFELFRYIQSTEILQQLS